MLPNTNTHGDQLGGWSLAYLESTSVVSLKGEIWKSNQEELGEVYCILQRTR